MQSKDETDIKQVIEAEVVKIKGTFKTTDKGYESSNRKLIEIAGKINLLSATSKPEELQAAIIGLRDLEVGNLEADFARYKVERDAKDARADLIEAISPQEKAQLKESISKMEAALGFANRQYEYYAAMDSRRTVFVQRMSDVISLIYAAQKESYDRAYVTRKEADDRQLQNRLSRYGLWVATFIGLFALGSLVLQALSVTKVFG